MTGWNEILGHQRSWAVVIGLVFQVLVMIGCLTMDNPNVAYILHHAPVILAALWGALVLGKSYEDRITGGTTSALHVWRSPGKEGGWSYALTRLLSDESFITTLLGSVLAIVALVAPLWPGLESMRELFTNLAYTVAALCGLLTGGLKYTAAHSDGRLSALPPAPPDTDPVPAPEPDEDTE